MFGLIQVFTNKNSAFNFSKLFLLICFLCTLKFIAVQMFDFEEEQILLGKFDIIKFFFITLVSLATNYK